jgi:hypothetical protein
LGVFLCRLAEAREEIMAGLSVLPQSLLLLVGSLVLTASYIYAQSRRIRTVLKMRAALAIVTAIALALTLSTAAGAATIVVNSLADPGAKGICALRDAITAANKMTKTNGCAAGTGNDTIQFSVTGAIYLASTLPQVTDRRLTINGPAAPGITIDGGQKVQVMQVALGATVNLGNLTIAHGNQNQLPGGDGGGIYNSGTLSVTNSTFSDNIAHLNASLEIGGFGGGIYNGGTLTITNSAFSGNGSDIRGGGIDNDGRLTVSNSTFSGNGSASAGGGIENGTGATLTVTNSTFSDDSAIGGGGVDNGGTLTVTNSTFSGNSGGGIYNGGTLTVTNSVFSGNGYSSSNGGGILNNGGTLSVTNSTFSDNIAVGAVVGYGGYGGGIYNDGVLIVTNSTFAGNVSASGLGGAIFNTDFASLKNTILASKSSGNCFILSLSDPTAVISDAGYNISDDNTCGFSATGSHNNTNPLLSAAGLANNGGPTQTIALDSESPAIDAIPFADCTDQFFKQIPTHQRGALRFDAGELQCDIGAYEFQDFAGQPDCGIKNISALIRRFGSLEVAASVLGFPSVKALLKAIQISCGG